MTLKLIRMKTSAAGCFGLLLAADSSQLAVTLEHAYEQANGSFAPKLPAGTYTCVRGTHQLHGMANPFTTFEITGVPGHTGILFHVGNFNKDSDGCVLLGESLASTQAAPMIANSRAAFERFMNGMSGINQFSLLVSEVSP